MALYTEAIVYCCWNKLILLKIPKLETLPQTFVFSSEIGQNPEINFTCSWEFCLISVKGARSLYQNWTEVWDEVRRQNSWINEALLTTTQRKQRETNPNTLVWPDTWYNAWWGDYTIHYKAENPSVAAWGILHKQWLVEWCSQSTLQGEREREKVLLGAWAGS